MTIRKNKEAALSLAAFVTPHGFGHAARAAATLLAIQNLVPRATFHLFTTVPLWFFEESGLMNVTHHPVITDIGLAQRTPLEEDLPETIRRLATFLPFDAHLVEDLAGQIRSAGCDAVLCDISALGIAVARSAGIPAVLQENFTWDWIYAGYPAEREQFAPYGEQLAAWYARADLHIQTTPVCLPATAYPRVAPVSRPITRAREEVRTAMDIPQNRPAVLISLGGIQPGPLDLGATQRQPDAMFIVPGASNRPERRGNLLLLPHHHGVYHPNLVNACDAVVGKLGYSTLAECYLAGKSFGFIPRARFPETPPMREFALNEMGSVEIDEQDFNSGRWVDATPGLLAKQSTEAGWPNGAKEVANLILDIVKWSG